MKKIVPFGNRIIVKRRKIGEKLGSGILIASEDTAERLTELAEVVALPNLTLADKALLDNAELVIESLTNMAKDGDAKSVQQLIEYTNYLQIKTLKVGDVVMVGRYATVEFTVGETGECLSITDPEGIRGLVIQS